MRSLTGLGGWIVTPHPVQHQIHKARTLIGCREPVVNVSVDLGPGIPMEMPAEDRADGVMLLS